MVQKGGFFPARREGIATGRKGRGRRLQERRRSEAVPTGSRLGPRKGPADAQQGLIFCAY